MSPCLFQNIKHNFLGRGGGGGGGGGMLPDIYVCFAWCSKILLYPHSNPTYAPAMPLIEMLFFHNLYVPQAAPQYEYTPNDYFMFSILTVAICGVISPLSLMFTIPALMFSRQVSLSWMKCQIYLSRQEPSLKRAVCKFLNKEKIF